MIRSLPIEHIVIHIYNPWFLLTTELFQFPDDAFVDKKLKDKNNIF